MVFNLGLGEHPAFPPPQWQIEATDAAIDMLVYELIKEEIAVVEGTNKKIERAGILRITANQR